MNNTPIKVLFIEDNTFDQIAFKQFVEQENLKYLYTIANTISDAKKILTTQEFDVVLTDHYLGDGTAFDLIEQVGSLEIPLIFLTGTGDEQIAIEALKKGIDDYLVKDVRDRNYLKALPVTIDRCIQNKQAQTESRILSHALMNSMDAIYITDEKDTIHFVNHAFISTYGYNKDDIVGLESRVLWCDPSDFLSNLGIQNHNPPQEVYHKRKNGMEFPVSVTRSIVQDYIGDNIVVINIARDITNQKEAQEQLDKAYKHVSDVQYAIDQHSIVVITDVNGVITYANDKFCEISQFSRDELLGKTHRVINSGYHPKEFFKDMWDTISQGNVWKGDVKNKSKDGSFYWVNSTIVPFLDNQNKPYQYVAIRTDITQMQNTKLKITEGKEYLEKLNNSLEDVILNVKLPERTIEYVNQSVEKLLGYSINECIGKTTEIFYPESESYQYFGNFLKQSVENGKSIIYYETKLKKKNSEIFYAHITTSFYEENNSKKVISIVRDISDEKLAKDALQDSIRRFHSLFQGFPLPTYIWKKRENDFTLTQYNYAAKEFTNNNISSNIGIQLSVYYKNRKDIIDDIHQCFNEETTIRRQLEYQFDFINEKKILDTTYSFVPPDFVLIHTDDITLRHEAKIALKKSEEKYRKIFELSPEAIVLLDRQGNVLDVNNRLYEWLGYYPENIIGKNLLDLPYLPDESKKIAMEVFSRRIQGEKIQPYELEFIGLNNERKFGWIMGAPLKNEEGNYDHDLVMISDITDRKKFEEDIKNSEQRLDLALKGADLGLWDWNIQTGHVIFNERWAEMLGYKLDEIDPHVSTWEKLVHPEDLPWISKVLTDHLEGRTPIYETEHRLLTKSGEWKWILDRGKVLEWDENKKPLRATGTHLDINEKKLAEQELKKHQDKLENLVSERTKELAHTVELLKEEVIQRKKSEDILKKYQERLINQEKRAVVGSLTAGLAHEIKNQLNPIALIELILNKLNDDEKKLAKYILDGRDRIVSLIDEVRGLAKNEETHYLISKYDLTNILEEGIILSKMDPEVKNTKIQLVSDFVGGVEINKDKIIQVLINLIRNASQAISGKHDGKIVIHAEGHGRFASVSITDNGCGIDDSHINHIWEPFYTTKGELGTGIGLDICKRIIEGHNGEISCVSKENEGSTFKFTLPASLPSENETYSYAD